jgi:HSP20 family protein
MKLDDIKHGLSSFWDSVSDGWQHLRQSASSSLTRFKLGIPAHRDR